MSRGAGRRLWAYLTRDLREIAFPSSLPDPPLAAGEQAGQRRRLTPALLLKAVRAGLVQYRASFRLSFPHLYEPDSAAPADGATATDRAEGEALQQELGAAARAGAQAARPYLRELYQTRAAAYRDGVREFVLGYREAFRDNLLQEAARLKRQADDAGPTDTAARPRT